MESVKPPRRTLRRRTFLESDISQTADFKLPVIKQKREKSGKIEETSTKPQEPDLELPLGKAHENCDSRIDIEPEPKQPRTEATTLLAAPRFPIMSVKPTKAQSIPPTSKDVPVPNSEQRSSTAVISNPDHVIQPTTSPVGFTFPITIPSGDKHVGATGPILDKSTPHLLPSHGMPAVSRSEPDKIDATSSSLRVMKPNPPKKKRLVVVSRMYEDLCPTSSLSKENNPVGHKDHNPPLHAESNPIVKTASIQDQSESSELVASVPKTQLVKDKPKSDVVTTCSKAKTGEQSTSSSSASSSNVAFNLWKAEGEEKGNSLENTSCIDKPQNTPEKREEAGPPVCADTKNGAGASVSQNTRDSPQSLKSVDTHQDVHHGTELATSIDSEDDEDEHDPMEMQKNRSRSSSSDTEIIDERNREIESFYKILELSSIRPKPGPKSMTRYQEIPNFNKPLWEVALEESRKERQMAAAEDASSSSDDSSSDSSDSDSADDDLNDPTDFFPNNKANEDGAPLKSNPQKPLPYPQQFDFIPNRAEDDANLIEDKDPGDPMALDEMRVTRDNGRKGVELNSTLQSSDSEAAPSVDVDETVQVGTENTMGDNGGSSGRRLDKATFNTQESQPASSHGDSDSDIEIIEELPCPRKSDRQSKDLSNQSNPQARKRNFSGSGQSSIKRRRMGSNDDNSSK